MRWLIAIIGLVIGVAPLGGETQELERAVPQTRAEVTLSFAPLVKQAAPAVVNIYAKKIVRRRQVASPLFNDPFFRRFFGDDPGFGQPRERTQNSLGSGVIVRADGLIITNHHVIAGADEITVVLADRRELTAEIVRDDERTDLAVLKIDTGGVALPFLELADSDTLQVGDLVLAIGNPFGVGQTVTSGIISALARTNVGITDYSFFIQTDAAINPGNSGGAMVTMDGMLAGVNTAIFTKSGGSQGIGFAVPANMVRTVIASVGVAGGLRRPWLGARWQSVTTEVAAALDLARPAGAIISDIYPDGPAARAGLATGDVVTVIDGHEVTDANALKFRMATGTLGEHARFALLRDGKRVEVDVPLEAAPEVPAREQTQLAGRQPLEGAVVVNLSPAMAEELGLDTFASGVFVIGIAQDSRAARVGVRPGDMLLEVNGEAVDSVATLGALMATPAEKWRLSLRRRGRVLVADVSL